jgi:sulfur relay (sulfurtransferase) DsrC/TusE family protein
MASWDKIVVRGPAAPAVPNTENTLCTKNYTKTPKLKSCFKQDDTKQNKRVSFDLPPETNRPKNDSPKPKASDNTQSPEKKEVMYILFRDFKKMAKLPIEIFLAFMQDHIRSTRSYKHSLNVLENAGYYIVFDLLVDYHFSATCELHQHVDESLFDNVHMMVQALRKFWHQNFMERSFIEFLVKACKEYDGKESKNTMQVVNAFAEKGIFSINQLHTLMHLQLYTCNFTTSHENMEHKWRQTLNQILPLKVKNEFTFANIVTDMIRIWISEVLDPRLKKLLTKSLKLLSISDTHVFDSLYGIFIQEKMLTLDDLTKLMTTHRRDGIGYKTEYALFQNILERKMFQMPLSSNQKRALAFNIKKLLLDLKAPLP